MRKSHKKALGLLGLATVVGMTAVAANLPTPAGAITSSVTDVINVTVVDNVTPEATVINIENGAIFTTSTLDIDVKYTNLSHLTVNLKWGDGSVTRSRSSANGTRTIYDQDFTYENRDGTAHLSINLDEYGGYNNYSISIEGTGYISGVVTPDPVNFRYTGASIEGAGTETDSGGNIIGSDIPVKDSNGDPIIKIETSDDVEKVIIQVLDKDGNEVIPPIESDGNSPITLPFEENKVPNGEYKIVITGKDGNGETVGNPITIIYDYQSPQDGKDIINIPSRPQDGDGSQDSESSRNPIIKVPGLNEGEYAMVTIYDKQGNIVFGPTRVGKDEEVEITSGLQVGEYNIIVTKYNSRGEVIGTTRYFYTYNPNAPETGSFFGNLNISRADDLTTGAIIFGIATVAAFFFLRKKKSSRRR